MKRCRAFTLIELLVVVVIIALLLAILLPSVARARKQVKTVVCLTNLRFMGETLRSYLDKNRKMIVYGGHATPSGAWDFQLFSDSRPLSDMTQRNGRGETTDRVRVCPETPPVVNAGASGGSAFTQWVCGISTAHSTGSYGFNTWLFESKNATNYRVFKMRDERSVPVFADAAGHDITADPDDPYDPRARFGPFVNLNGVALDRHNKAVNVSFFDGRVETVKLGTLWTLNWAANWQRRDPMKMQ